MAKFIRAVIRDARRFYGHSGAFRNGTEEESLASLIRIDYHRLEKGLALPQRRKGFGVTAASDLQNNLSRFLQHHGCKLVFLEAMSALEQYYSFSESVTKNQADLYAQYITLKESIESSDPPEEAIVAGACETTRREILDAVTSGYEKFFSHRHSVRSFSDKDVDNADITKAVSIAQNAPSVCNRQAWRLHCVSSSDRIRAILTIQGGARGFEDGPKRLLVLSVDIRAFHSLGERNECWVDGGIFTMSLLSALHSQGLASCPLNWCVDTGRDEELRKLLDIPPFEVVVVLVAVGHYPDELRVAVSPRKDVAEVIRYC